MLYHIQSPINPVVAEQPDPSAANALQKGPGGQFSGIRTMMKYMFQSFHFGSNATAYRNVIESGATEEISQPAAMKSHKMIFSNSLLTV